jgi:hypothetical protein
MIDDLQILNISLNVVLTILLIVSEILPFSGCKAGGIVHSISLHFYPIGQTSEKVALPPSTPVAIDSAKYESRRYLGEGVTPISYRPRCISGSKTSDDVVKKVSSDNRFE